MTTCNIRFLDNQKVASGSYTVTNESVDYPLSNAIDKIRSRVFRTTGTTTRITLDLIYEDNVNALTLFAPLGEVLGVSKEATIKLQADNVNDWASPELDLSIDMTSDDKLVYFTDTNYRYRFWSLYIDDPTNSKGYLEIADIFIGNYTTTAVRNLAPKFGWEQVDKAKSTKSIDGTAYFDTRYKYDRLTATRFAYVDADDRQTLQNLFNRLGRESFFPLCVDPEAVISKNKEELTKLVRFDGAFKAKQLVKERFEITMSFVEVV